MPSIIEDIIVVIVNIIKEIRFDGEGQKTVVNNVLSIYIKEIEVVIKNKETNVAYESIGKSLGV